MEQKNNTTKTVLFNRNIIWTIYVIKNFLVASRNVKRRKKEIGENNSKIFYFSQYIQKIMVFTCNQWWNLLTRYITFSC